MLYELYKILFKIYFSFFINQNNKKDIYDSNDKYMKYKLCLWLYIKVIFLLCY